MSSIYDIPYEDIKIFLSANDSRRHTENKDEAYNNAFLLLKDKNSKGHTTNIIEWMMAHNLIVKKIKINNYTVDEIDGMSQDEINQLSKKLGMNGNNRINIKNILKYLNRLNEVKILLLPEINDSILNILNKLEIQDINVSKLTYEMVDNLLRTDRNKKEIRKFISSNLEKIVIYNTINSFVNFGNTGNNISLNNMIFALSFINKWVNVYNKKIVLEIIKDNESLVNDFYTKYYNNNKLSSIIKQIDDVYYEDEIHIYRHEMNKLIKFTIDLIIGNEIGLAKKTYDIINKFKYNELDYSYNYYLVQNLVELPDIKNFKIIFKYIIDFMGEDEFLKNFDFILREGHLASINIFLQHLVKSEKYIMLINIIQLNIDYLYSIYTRSKANEILLLLDKITEAIKSKNKLLIFKYVKSIITILDN